MTQKKKRRFFGKAFWLTLLCVGVGFVLINELPYYFMGEYWGYCVCIMNLPAVLIMEDYMGVGFHDTGYWLSIFISAIFWGFIVACLVSAENRATAREKEESEVERTGK